MKKMLKRIGFTLIEMLVVVAIISILATIGLVTYSGAQRKARDGRRQTDIEQIRSALEMYRSNEGDGLYPNSLAALTSYLSPLPTDPKDGTDYNYSGVDCGVDGCSGYTLTGTFETMSYTATEMGIDVDEGVTSTPTATSVPTSTSTPTATSSPSPEPEPTNTSTPTPTGTPTPTRTPTPTSSGGCVQLGGTCNDSKPCCEGYCFKNVCILLILE